MSPSGATISFLFLAVFVLLSSRSVAACDNGRHAAPPTICIIGSGIGGSSVAHFLRSYSADPRDADPPRIRMFERHSVVGGRMATVTIAGDTFEAGASILHPKNYHTRNFTKLLNLAVKGDDDSDSFGIWNGKTFLFKTISVNFKSFLVKKIVSLANILRMFVRYGFSLIKMQNFAETMLDRFLKYYDNHETRPTFETVDEMLKWSGLYNLTQRTLQQELIDAKLSPLLIDELITVITRVNYGQSVHMSGLAGAVALAGSGDGLWSVQEGNWRMAEGLIKQSDVSLHLNEEIASVSFHGPHYEINSTKGSSYMCNVTVVATPIDELNIEFSPPVSVPARKLQHTYTTFVRGVLNPAYFGLSSVSDLPELVGTVEDPELPFSCISVLKKHDERDMTYKIFSRKPMQDAVLDNIFSARQETVRIDWAAYPRYHAPELFAPFNLDGHHLYYVNAFENAASAMEASAVAAENVARLILSRFFIKGSSCSSGFKSCGSDTEAQDSDMPFVM